MLLLSDIRGVGVIGVVFDVVWRTSDRDERCTGVETEQVQNLDPSTTSIHRSSSLQLSRCKIHLQILHIDIPLKVGDVYTVRT